MKKTPSSLSVGFLFLFALLMYLMGLGHAVMSLNTSDRVRAFFFATGAVPTIAIGTAVIYCLCTAKSFKKK